MNDFIKKAKEKHGDKYDYSKVEYVNSKTKVIIICEEHGEFLQTPTDHYNGGCKKCADMLRNETRRFTIEELVQKAKEIHGDKYDYSNAQYDGKKINNINCKIHGKFKQSMDVHINRKGGCKKCGDILRGKNRMFTTEEFIKKSIEKHGDKYDYSKVEYNGTYNKIIIICREHGEFLQTPTSHIRGCGCQLCYDNRRGETIRKTTEEFIINAKKIHGDDKYDYSRSSYVSMDDKIIIICKIHGEFSQVAYSHINGLGCWNCGVIKRTETKRSNTDEFIEKAINKHGKKYDYSKVNYIDNMTHIIIICKKHGEYLQRPNNHLNYMGCSLCSNKTEGILCEKLQLTYPTIITQFKQDWCKKVSYLPFDFCIPDYNIIIELDGIQHFQQVRDWKTPEEQLQTDKYKEKRANENGYSIIRLLQEDVFYDKYDWYEELCDTIEEIIKNKVIKNYYLCKNDEYKNYY
jgi:very-short-patch-repair endonuclease